MKVKRGDLVRLVRLSTKDQIGIVISNPFRLHGENRFDLLMEDGTVVKDLPRPYMELVSESR
jgi:hypothetical protein